MSRRCSAPLEENARHDLLEVIDDRAGTRSTILTSQLLVEHWHGWINDPTLADALLNRLVHIAYRIVTDAATIQIPCNRGENTGHELAK